METYRSSRIATYKAEKSNQDAVFYSLKKIEEENKRIFIALLMQSLLNLNHQSLKINLFKTSSDNKNLSLLVVKIDKLFLELPNSQLGDFLKSNYPIIYSNYQEVKSYISKNNSFDSDVLGSYINSILLQRQENVLADESSVKHYLSESSSSASSLVDSFSDVLELEKEALPLKVEDINMQIPTSPSTSFYNIRKKSTSKTLRAKEEEDDYLDKSKKVNQIKGFLNTDIGLNKIQKRSPSLEELAKSGKVAGIIKIMQQTQSAFQTQEDDVDHKKKKRVSFLGEDFTDLALLDSSSSENSSETFKNSLQDNNKDYLSDLAKEQRGIIKMLLEDEKFSKIFNTQAVNVKLACNANNFGIFDLLNIERVFKNKNSYNNEDLKAVNIFDFNNFDKSWRDLIENTKMNLANYDTRKYGEIGILLKNDNQGIKSKDKETMALEKYEYLRVALKDHLWDSCSKKQKDELLNQQRFKNVMSKTKISDLSQLEKMQLRYRFRKICTNQFFPKDLELALMRLEVDGVEPSNIPRESMVAAERILGIFLNNINKKQESLLSLDNYEEKLIEKTKSALFQGEIGNQLRQEISEFSDSNPNLATDKLKKFEELIKQNYGNKCLVDCQEMAIDKYNRHQFYTARTELLGFFTINHALQELGVFFNLSEFGNKGIILDNGALLTSWLLNSGEAEVLEKLNKFEGLKDAPLLQNQKILAKQIGLPLPIVSAISELDQSYPDLLCFIKDNWRNYNLASFNKYQLILNPHITNPKGWLEACDISTTFISDIRNKTTPRTNNYNKNCNNLGDISLASIESALSEAEKELENADSSKVEVLGCKKFVDLVLEQAQKFENGIFHLPSRR